MAYPVVYAAGVGGLATVVALATMWGFGLFDSGEKKSRQTTWHEKY